MVTVAASLGFSACAGARRTPPDAVDTFARALERRDYARAYRCMSAAYRTGVPFDEFVARAGRTTPADLTRWRTMAARARTTVRLEAVDDEDGTGDGTLPLVRDNGGWSLATDPWGSASGARSPRAALRLLLRAVELGRYDWLWTLAPEVVRAQAQVDGPALRRFWEDGPPERRAWLAALAIHVDDPIVVSGDQASLAWADRANGAAAHAVTLVRENGTWRIETIE